MEEMNEYNEIEVDACSTTIIVKTNGVKELVNTDDLRCQHHDHCFYYFTLEDIVKQLEEKYGTKDLVIDVIYEMGLSGIIYRYGNNGPSWTTHGKTKGFA